MHRRENHHRRGIWICTRDALIHIEQIAITLGDRRLAVAGNRIAKVEEYTEARRSNSATFIANFLGRARRNIAWRQIAKAWILALEEVIALLFGNCIWIERTFANLLGNLCRLRSPDTTVITQRLGHQRQLRLLVAVHRNTSWVNLCVARIRKTSTSLVSAICSRHVTSLCIG